MYPFLTNIRDEKIKARAIDERIKYFNFIPFKKSSDNVTKIIAVITEKWGIRNRSMIDNAIYIAKPVNFVLFSMLLKKFEICKRKPILNISEGWSVKEPRGIHL